MREGTRGRKLLLHTEIGVGSAGGTMGKQRLLMSENFFSFISSFIFRRSLLLVRG